jgi:hypothetical protein
MTTGSLRGSVDQVPEYVCRVETQHAPLARWAADSAERFGGAFGVHFEPATAEDADRTRGRILERFIQTETRTAERDLARYAARARRRRRWAR